VNPSGIELATFLFVAQCLNLLRHRVSPFFIKLTLMYGMEHTKFISAEQAKPVYKYKSTKEKLLKTNASIWFNKMYRTP
jgi:hypothetical protein